MHSSKSGLQANCREGSAKLDMGFRPRLQGYGKGQRLNGNQSGATLLKPLVSRAVNQQSDDPNQDQISSLARIQRLSPAHAQGPVHAGLSLTASHEYKRAVQGKSSQWAGVGSRPPRLMITPTPDDDAPLISEGREGRFRGSLVFHLTFLFSDHHAHPIGSLRPIPSESQETYEFPGHTDRVIKRVESRGGAVG
jgi:hypothetical protein